MRRFCWRERNEKLNWRLLSDLNIINVVQRGDPALLEPYALHITFARLPNPSKDPSTRDAWFLVRILQLAMEFLLFMRMRDNDVLESLSQELRLIGQERDGLVTRLQKWKARAHSGDKQVEKLHQVLQNIAKLLQVHGASPSAVATIETLLTELISERRARQKSRAITDTHGDDGDAMSSAVQEARVCGFCSKLFSSAEYLEKHLVRRHRGESIEVETPEMHKMRQDLTCEAEKRSEMRNVNVVATEAIMKKMVQQIEKALHEHEERIRSIAQDEEEKVEQMCKRLHTETKVVEEMRARQLQIERLNENLQQQLDKMSIQKQESDEKLGDLKQQIEFLTAKKKIMGTLNDVVLPFDKAHKSDDALIAAENEINTLRQTLEDMKAELTSARRELTKVQALHLSALRKKKELADKLALSRVVSSIRRQEMSSQTERAWTVYTGVQAVEQHTHLPCEVSTVMQQNKSSQTEQPCIVNETVQTDAPSNLVLEEVCLPFCKDVGTDPILISSYADGKTQTLERFVVPPFNAEVDFSIVDDSLLECAPRLCHVSPTSISHRLLIADAGGVAEQVEILEQAAHKVEDRILDSIQQLTYQNLLDIVDERAQSAVSRVASSNMPVSRNCSSFSRHKCVRSVFQHDEGVAKERVASCLEKLEEFAQRFGIPPKSARISFDNFKIVKSALRGHLEVLPTEVLSKMVICENAVSAMIEKEWVPMEKTRQNALELFRMKTQAKSEINQGLVRQAMAALKTVSKQSGAIESREEYTGRSLSSNDVSATRFEADESSTKTNNSSSIRGTARRYSANNQLTVVVGDIAKVESSLYHYEHTSQDVKSDEVLRFDDTKKVMLS